MILGMDWLSLHNGLIGCADKVVHLTNSDGIQVTCHTRGSGTDPMVFSMEARSLNKCVISLLELIFVSHLVSTYVGTFHLLSCLKMTFHCIA